MWNDRERLSRPADFHKRGQRKIMPFIVATVHIIEAMSP